MLFSSTDINVTHTVCICNYIAIMGIQLYDTCQWILIPPKDGCLLKENTLTPLGSRATLSSSLFSAGLGADRVNDRKVLSTQFVLYKTPLKNVVSNGFKPWVKV